MSEAVPADIQVNDTSEEVFVSESGWRTDCGYVSLVDEDDIVDCKCDYRDPQCCDFNS
ncbi:hypothetical protein JYU34_010612 [Plutella xylostella]|uniref:Uncharacterized protein n=1 Tax=Plutella xylostella TaxID=51655 RepID=A0ABQ7QIT3_PLUXY|nr:hypothetical protein JYU34_010612 [Plutella xylostella]